ncbi:MAG: hypothetical protein LZ171_05325 [Thaumarchaeota archaeon]|jgi:predicted transcriptional regulator|nr:hypothetical protein [Candidatus Geocrenenecus arthurdayi]MCL7391445.1 hypothetical protein [Candidatus Geocrenenecus arthurdayi]
MSIRSEQLVPAIRAKMIKILIEKYSYSRRRASQILNISPAAVTHYMSGRRGRLLKLLEEPRASKLINEVVEKIVSKGGRVSEAEIYDLALTLSSIIEEKKKGEIKYSLDQAKNKLIRTLRERAQAEHEAAEKFMETASKLDNDITRMIFRQIASDSIKHADVLMSTISILERGEEIKIEVPKKNILQSLLEKEEVAHIHSLDEVKSYLPHKLLKVLLESVEADERKHAKILRSLIELAEEKS